MQLTKIILIQLILFIFSPSISTTSQHINSITKQLSKIKAIPKHRIYIKKHKYCVTNSFLREQQKLIKYFSSTDHNHITTDEFKQGVAALKRGDRFPILTTYHAIINTAITKLHTTSGFNRLMKLIIVNLHNPYSLAGYLYEIEKGLQIITQENEETILSLQEPLSSPYSKTTREFDIVTNKRLIECKNINWKNKRNRIQFRTQKKITDEINQSTYGSLLYEVCSKQPIPEEDQRWFQKENIHFSID